MSKLFVMQLAQGFASQIMAKVDVKLPLDPNLADKAIVDLVQMQWEIERSYYHTIIKALALDDPNTGWPAPPETAGVVAGVSSGLGGTAQPAGGAGLGGLLKSASPILSMILPMVAKAGPTGAAIAGVLQLLLGSAAAPTKLADLVPAAPPMPQPLFAGDSLNPPAAAAAAPPQRLTIRV